MVPAVEGEPLAGFVVGTISSDPTESRVIGPESRVREVTAATTEPVVITGKRETVRDEATIGVIEPDVRPTTALRARVTVSITPAPVERVIDRVPVQVRNASSGVTARIEPATVRVSVRGTREQLRALRSDAVKAFVELPASAPGATICPQTSIRWSTSVSPGLIPRRWKCR